jgi:ferredoxin-thioredoxin reductase catalytic subunit/rubredoxin
MSEITQEQVDTFVRKLDREAKEGGYNLNPDSEFTKDLANSLLVNQDRYGYQACPCRLATGRKEDDLDIICPCDYRDADVLEHGACYCALYVSQKIAAGIESAHPIPERRPKVEERKRAEVKKTADPDGKLSYPVWRCKVCGYLCARDGAPEVCPICKAKKERFERFI